MGKPDLAVALILGRPPFLLLRQYRSAAVTDCRFFLPGKVVLQTSTGQFPVSHKADLGWPDGGRNLGGWSFYSSNTFPVFRVVGVDWRRVPFGPSRGGFWKRHFSSHPAFPPVPKADFWGMGPW